MQRRVWEGIAKSWDRHRQEPEKPVLDFTKDKKFLLDLGCGSGRNFFKGKKYIGVDFSIEMLKLARQNAKKKGAKALLMRADLAALPLKDDSFENVLLVATLHVMEGRKRRLCLREMKHVMKKNAHALITVWNKEHPRFIGTKKVVFVPWKVGNKRYMRYYYLFEKDELKELLNEYFEVQYIESQKRLKQYDENIIAVVKKL